MKKILLSLTIASAALFATAQDYAYMPANPMPRPAMYSAPATQVAVVDSRYMVYDNTYARPGYTNIYLSDRITYHTEYDVLYDTSTGSSFAKATPLIKSRAATRVVFMPDCLQSLLAQRYGVGKNKHGYEVRTDSGHVYYEVNVDGKNIRFDDLCNVDLIGYTKHQ